MAIPWLDGLAGRMFGKLRRHHAAGEAIDAIHGSTTTHRQTVFLRTTVRAPQGASLQDRFLGAVANTGNFFFEEALERQLDGVATVTAFDALPSNVDTLVLSMSNFISPATDLGHFADEIERRGIPHVVMVGAGAQADDYDDELALTDGTARFVRLLSERSQSIGVRGMFTAEVLRGMGIPNVEVIGCPTAFWPDSTPIAEPDGKPTRIAVHCTPTGMFRDKLGELFAHAIKFDASYVIQSEAWMIPLLDQSLSPLRDQLRTDAEVAYYTHKYVDQNAFKDWISRRGMIYFDIDEWILGMKDYDFVYGSRFHGNMAAIQAGVPALNMPFDTRTRELCEYLNLPQLPLDRFSGSLRPEDLYNLADFSLYNRTLPLRRKEYFDFLRRSGLPLKSDLRDVETCRWSRVVENSERLLREDASIVNLSPEQLADARALRRRRERSLENRHRAERGLQP